MKSWVVLLACVCSMATLTHKASAQRRQLIESLLQNLRIKSNQIRSPSFNGERKYDVIGTGNLPLQRPDGVGSYQSQSAPSFQDVIRGTLSRFQSPPRGNPAVSKRRLEKDSDSSPVVKKEDVKLPFIEVKDDVKMPFVDKKVEEDVYIFPERKPDPITPRPLPQRPTLTDLTVAPPRHLSAELTPPRPLPADLKPPISLLNNLNPPNKQPAPVRPARPLNIDLTPPNQPSRPLPGQLQKPNISRKPEKNPKKPIYPKPGKFQGPNKSNIPKFQKLMEQANRFQNPSKLSPFQINKLLEGRRFDQNADMLIRDQVNRFGPAGGFGGPGGRPRRPNNNELRNQRLGAGKQPLKPVGGRRKSTSNNSFVKGIKRNPLGGGGGLPPRRRKKPRRPAYSAPNLLYHEFEPSFKGSEKFAQDLDTGAPEKVSSIESIMKPEPGSFASGSLGDQAAPVRDISPSRYQPPVPAPPPTPVDLGPPEDLDMPKFPHFEDPFSGAQGTLNTKRVKNTPTRRPQIEEVRLGNNNNRYNNGFGGGSNNAQSQNSGFFGGPSSNDFNVGSRRQELYSNEPEQPQNSNNEENTGFFKGVQESFPDISDFGLEWEPQKIRNKRSVTDTERSLSRSKRSPIKNPFYYSDPRAPAEREPPRRLAEKNQRRRRPQGYNNRRPQQLNDNRRQGPKGFWDDADFDAEFFNGGGPNTFSSIDDFSQENAGKYSPLRPNSEYQFQDDPYPTNRPSPYPEQNRYQQPVRDQPKDYRPVNSYDKYPVGNSDGYSFFNNNDYNIESFNVPQQPQPPQHDKRHAFQVVDKEPERDTYKYNYYKDPTSGLSELNTLRPAAPPAPHAPPVLIETDQYEDPPRLQQQFNTLRPEDNEILGSGNFDVIKGGTFYDQDEVRYHSGNRRPSGYTYGQDFFHNFRDFADIKRKANKGYYY